MSFDIDVLLFLPIYAERRVHDLRLIAHDEAGLGSANGTAGNQHMDGQLNFSSGWEWGYWLNDVVAARAAWNPQEALSSDAAALTAIAEPAMNVFGSARSVVIDWINAVAMAEHELLIYGSVNGKLPKTPLLRNGQAYLQGFDAWDDVSALATYFPIKLAQMTQPARLGMVSMRSSGQDKDPPDYQSELEPLLRAMRDRFATLAAQGNSLREQVPSDAKAPLDDLADAANMLALRARQQYYLYQYVNLSKAKSVQAKPALQEARAALDEAAKVVGRREANYAIADTSRVNAWQAGPTGYHFGYLWTVHSLYYWWRDEGKAVDNPHSPCYLNIINPIDVGFGEGLALDASSWIARLFNSGITNSCLDIPTKELSFPFDGLRERS